MLYEGILALALFDLGLISEYNHIYDICWYVKIDSLADMRILIVPNNKIPYSIKYLIAVYNLTIVNDVMQWFPPKLKEYLY